MENLSNCKKLILSIIDLLEQESTCLRQGVFQDLGTISMKKLDLMNELDLLMKDPIMNDTKSVLTPEIGRLNRISEENGLLLQGVYNGTRAAQVSLARVKHQAAQVGTYGRKGERHILSETGLVSEKTV